MTISRDMTVYYLSFTENFFKLFYIFGIINFTSQLRSQWEKISLNKSKRLKQKMSVLQRKRNQADLLTFKFKPNL